MARPLTSGRHEGKSEAGSRPWYGKQALYSVVIVVSTDRNRNAATLLKACVLGLVRP